MVDLPTDLHAQLKDYDQEHVLAGWDQLTRDERRAFIDQLGQVNLPQLRQLYAERDQTYTVPSPERITPAPVAQLDETDATLCRRGEEALRHGEVAALVVAGGQGSRLGLEHPKGLFPIGPVTNKSLFQIHAEKVLALTRRYGKPVPMLIMTSPATHAETEDFFRSQRCFGLPAENVHFFQQGTMPALDVATGRLLLERPGRLFASPNGHGGTLTALADSGLLNHLEKAGIRQIFYFQVDNPLIRIADPLFLGHHLQADAEVSSKVVPKESSTDRLGNLVLIDGRCSIIEYSDLPESLAHQTEANSRLRFRAGNPAVHVFTTRFLERVTHGPERMPFHVAKKKVPHWDPPRGWIEPEKENALKFELFIFDVLPLADRWTLVETSRRGEFQPLKNATGPDSPQTVKQAISNLAGDWLDKAGVGVPRRPDGDVAVPLEISPLFALDADELARKVSHDTKINGQTYLG